METYSNHPGTTLSAAITGTSRPVTFSVVSAAGLPATGNFRVIIDSELLTITAISGTSLTGSNVEGTAAATHLIGATVQHVLSAGSLGNIVAQSVGGRLLYPPPGITGQTTTLSADITNSATSMSAPAFTSAPTLPFYVMIETEQVKVTAISGTTWTIARGDASTTAAAHLTGVTITERIWFYRTFMTGLTVNEFPGSFIRINMPGRAEGQSWNIGLAKRIDIGSPWRVTFALRFGPNSNLGNYATMGAFLWNPATATSYLQFRSVFSGAMYSASPMTWGGSGYAATYGTALTYPDNLNGIIYTPLGTNLIWYRFTIVGSNRVHEASLDGQSWFRMITDKAATDYITATHAGFWVSPQGSANSAAELVSYLEESA